MGRFRRVQRRRVRRAHGGQCPGARAADRALRARARTGGDALVVNLLDSKLAAPNPDYLSYTLSKQALAGLTELAARALAPQGIRVNGIAPALMLRSSGQSEENFAAMHANNPLRPRRRAGRRGRRAPLPDRRDAASPARCSSIDSGQRFMALDRDVQFLGDAMSVSEPKLDRAWCRTISRSARRGSCSNSLAVQADIGFHEFEIGAPQRLLVTVEIWLEDADAPADDDPHRAWNYDFLRTEVEEIAAARRYNLQETLAHADLRPDRRLPRRESAARPHLQAGRLSGRARRRRRNRFLFRSLARSLNRWPADAGFHAFRMWNKIRCAAFEPEIRRRACRR